MLLATKPTSWPTTTSVVPMRKMRSSRNSLRMWFVSCLRLGKDRATDCCQAEDADSFEVWEKFVRACESLEGGLNRNSSPQSIAATRDAYDRFLHKFPLLFGYWKKYADLEFSIAGTEAAELVRFRVPKRPIMRHILISRSGVRARCC